MIDVGKMDYRIAEDYEFVREAEGRTTEEMSELTGISRNTLYETMANNRANHSVLEKFYSYAYESKYRLNSVKEDLLNESGHGKILFHGSKKGLREIEERGSKDKCDFGSGFYLSETYEHALSFVCENAGSSVYSFLCNFDGLKIAQFECSLEWMLAICNYRGTIKSFSDSETVKKIVDKVEHADLVIAPIADNRMFYIMSLFAEGDINADVALHSLSASKLGLQYIFKTEKALDALYPVEKYYLCKKEKADCQERLKLRAAEIDTKLKLSRREYKTGLYIEELLK